MIQRIRVPLGFVFAFIFLLFAEPTAASLSWGSLIGLSGILIRLWAAGHLRKHEALTRSGPYRWTRNPLYLGSFLIGFGLMIAAWNPWLLGLFVLLFFAIYFPVMRREEEELIRAYAPRYEQYRASVPLFIPTLQPGPRQESSNFSWDRVILNREYNALLGYVVIIGILVFKLMIRGS